LNEKQAIVTSLNLLLSSEINSIELGYITESTEEHAELVEFCKRQLSIDFDFQKATTKPKNSGNWQKDICNSLSSALDEKVIISQVDGLLKIKTGSGQYECFIWSSNTNLLRISGILSAKEYESARNPVGYFASHTGFKIELQPGSAKYPNLVWCTLEKNLQSQDISKLIEADITFVSEKIIDFVTTIEEFRSEN
jgi:hypothetical protein